MSLPVVGSFVALYCRPTCRKRLLLPGPIDLARKSLAKLRIINLLVALGQAHFHRKVVLRTLPDSYDHPMLQ